MRNVLSSRVIAAIQGRGSKKSLPINLSASTLSSNKGDSTIINVESPVSCFREHVKTTSLEQLQAFNRVYNTGFEMDFASKQGKTNIIIREK